MLPVYENLKKYRSVFTPLMLLEVWAIVCQNMGSSRDSLSAVICAPPKLCDDGFAYIEFKATSKTLIFDMELVTLNTKISPKGLTVKVFAVVEGMEMFSSNKWRENEVEVRPSNFKFTLRLLKSHVPNTLDQDFIVNKLSSLNMVVEQFILNAELANSSLFDEILRPSENVNVFKLDTATILENNTALNSGQLKAVHSITTTRVHASTKTPKIALLHGSQGKF